MSTKRDQQLLLEELFDKNQRIPEVKKYYEEHTIPFKQYAEDEDIPYNLVIAILVQMYLHKRCLPGVLFGVLRRIEPDIKQLAVYLDKAVATGLLGYDDGREEFYIVLDISPELNERLEKFCFPMPMLIEPDEIKQNDDNGYISTSGSVLLNNCFHDKDIALDHLNRVNAIPLGINEDVSKFIQNKWKHLDKPKVGETRTDYAKRVKAFAKYDKYSKDILKLFINQDNKFYLTHKYDKRGRSYVHGYYINYQGNDWNKAVVELANKEVVV